MHSRSAGRSHDAAPGGAGDGLSLPLLGRILGGVYVAGGAVAVVWTQLPRGAARGTGTVIAMALLAVALGLVLSARARHLGAPAMHAVLAVIQVVIAVGCIATGEPATDLRLFFLWATPFAALYFGGRAAAAHLVWTITAATVAVVACPGPTPPSALASTLLLHCTLTAGSFVVTVAARALRRAEAQQRHQASRDPLTGLRNRRALLEVLQDVLRDEDRCTSALLLVDLDGFKAVNDRFGHARGDDVLREVAARLAGALGPRDLACRLGGDEFALVLRDVVDPADVRTRAQRAADALVLSVGAHEQSLGTEQHQRVRASVGVRLLTGDPGTPTEALRDADVALYASKRAGRATPVLWHDDLQRADEVVDELAAELERALEESALHLVYQPVVDVRTMRVHAVEALARWRHAVRGDVPPDVFVPCAEQAGLAPALTRWVLRTACETARGWPVPLDGTPVQLAVNVSALQLADLHIVADVQAVLTSSGLPAARLVLEVTETAEVGDLAQAQRTLQALSELGVTLALDDFGTGRSSLTHVQALPFDVLKIDRSCVSAAAAGDRRALATVAAVGALAGQLEVAVVAEGVEDVRELEQLRALGCASAQGFGLFRPAEAAAVRAALSPPRPGGWVLETGAVVPAQERRCPTDLERVG